MKHLLLSLCFFLTCCDNTDIEKQTIKCGLAISELGNAQARSNFRIRENIPHIMADIYLIEEEAKDELGMYSTDRQRQHRLMIDEYNSWFCRDIHSQAKIEPKTPVTSQPHTMMAHRK
ncbi:hypothetical protein F9C28_13085 [Shimwellia pseudoproteus]|uniref:hypothetical protein n=1 Tax=Shimwellia pseudoproteus TaxID=570012 RepID=UPI0018EDBC1E|nr:hypothetical protein [Shimwellia pseudoproteus]MBJ3815841.1 hypothetical protein [Shimwellia pseudoproteus]